MHKSFNHLQLTTEDYAFELYLLNQHSLSIVPPGDHPHGILLDQHETTYSFIDTVPVQDAWRLPMEQGPLFRDVLSTVGMSSVPSQHPKLYAEKGVQADQSDYIADSQSPKGRLVQIRPAIGRLISQVPYKPTKLARFNDPRIIRFVVSGQAGIRLSDALEGNWAGFEGRDNRTLFEGTGSQIIIRLHLIGCPPWHSKVSILDFTKLRQPIMKTKLAAGVAKSVKKFFARERSKGHGENHPQCRWGDISLENVILTQIVRVSSGSWQPELFLDEPPVASPPTASSSSSLGLPV